MPEENSSIEEFQTEKKGGFFKELLKFVLIAFLIVVPFRWFVAQPFIVNGASMVPTFENGEYLIVDQISHRIKNPERGEVIIFKYPEDPSKYFIKRIIGLPGETLEIEGLQTKIINDEHPEGFIIEEDYIVYQKNNKKMIIELKDDEYFVMGDNRAASSDSRLWGPLNDNLLVGRPLFRLYPVKRFNILPGDHSGS